MDRKVLRVGNIIPNTEIHTCNIIIVKTTFINILNSFATEPLFGFATCFLVLLKCGISKNASLRAVAG
jgi:hypothetical protein